MQRQGMQMHGSRLLAFGATVAGFGGLALTLAGGSAAFVGLLLAAVALLTLLSTTWVAAQPAPQEQALPVLPAIDPGIEYEEPDMVQAQEDEWFNDSAPPLPEPEPMPPPARSRGATRAQGQRPVEETNPDIDLDSPLQRALAGLPPKPSAPPRYSARMPVIPEDEAQEEPAQRARRLVPSGQTLGEKREAAKKARAKPAADDMEFTVVPKARPAPRASVTGSPRVPVVVARRAGKGPVPADLARGKCSGCDTILWAPKVRPLNLRCPECDKITLLK